MIVVECPDCGRQEYRTDDDGYERTVYEQCDCCARAQYEAEYEEAKADFEETWWG